MLDRSVESQSVRALSKYSADTLLDVGCGTGELSTQLAAACGASTVYGIDISHEALQEAKARGIKTTRLDLNEGSLPFADNQFDVVHSGDVFDYIENTSNYFNEIRRVLSEGGAFVFSTVNLTSLHNRLAMLFGQRPFPMRPEHDCVHSPDGPGILESSDRINVERMTEVKAAAERHGFSVRAVLGATAVHQHHRVARRLRLIDHLLSLSPKYSFRIVLVCENPASTERRP